MTLYEIIKLLKKKVVIGGFKSSYPTYDGEIIMFELHIYTSYDNVNEIIKAITNNDKAPRQV